MMSRVGGSLDALRSSGTTGRCRSLDSLRSLGMTEHRSPAAPLPSAPHMRLLALLALCAAAIAPVRYADEPPRDWIDPATGHRVIRLSSEPGSQTLYFHDNQYSPEGDRYVFTSRSGIWLVDLTRLGKEPPTPELIVPNAGGAYMARRTREVYFTRLPASAAGAPAGARGPV